MIVNKRNGYSLVEIMIAIAMIGIFVLGMATAYRAISKGTITSKTRTIANNIAQEKVESLKDLNYYRLRVTPLAAISNPYDTSNPYPPETVTIDTLTFTRLTIIKKVKESGGNLQELAPTDQDEGLKKVEIEVTWVENGISRSLTQTNVRENPDRPPLDGAIKGTVTEQGTSNPVENAKISVVDNPAYSAYTDSSGYYVIAAPIGTCMVRADKREYVSAVSSSISVTSGNTAQYDFTDLVLKSKGNAAGIIYVCDHLVISHLATGTTDSSIEFVEIYNPTQYPITIDNSNFKIKYIDSSNTIHTLAISWINNTVPSHGYFLFGSTNPVTATVFGVPVSVVPDATFAAVMEPDKGGIGISDNNDVWLDRVGWSQSGHSAPSNAVETTGKQCGGGGLITGDSLIRYTHSGSADSSEGNSYDTNDNSLDFLYFFPANLLRAPRNSSSSAVSPVTGTPYSSANIFADDGLSYPANSNASGSYTLSNIEAKACTLSASGGTFYAAVGISVSAGTTLTKDIVMDGTTNYGYISGEVRSGGNPLSDILMNCDGVQAYTDSIGSYRLSIEAGVHYVQANYNNTNVTYTSVTTSSPVTVAVGQVSSGINFDLSSGGAVSGTITTNGIDALPNVVVIAKDFWNVQKGDAISDTNGNYTISNLATSGNSYKVMPTLDTSETCTPSYMSISVSAGSTQTGANFIITTGLCNVSGNIKTSAGINISTGALIIATVDPITVSSPPTIDSTFRSGTVVYYSAMSNSEGNYSMQVRGSPSPGTSYHVYSWYTNISGVTLTQSTTITATTGGNITAVNFTY